MNEKQWESIIKKEGCAFKPLYKVRHEFANMPHYMYIYIKHKIKNTKNNKGEGE